MAYATTSASVAVEPGAVTARLVMAPRIGPAQGVQTRPRPTPVIRPPATPGLARLAPTAGMRAVTRSHATARAGTRSVSPKTAMTTMAASRSVELGRFRASMIWTLASVKNEKLAMSPAITRYGRRLSPSAPVASTIGRIGSTQGETAVTSPAMKATTISRAMNDSGGESQERSNGGGSWTGGRPTAARRLPTAAVSAPASARGAACLGGGDRTVRALVRGPRDHSRLARRAFPCVACSGLRPAAIQVVRTRLLGG